MNHFTYKNLLILLSLTTIAIFFIEIFDLVFCNNRFVPIWEIGTTFGTIGAVFAALVLPIIHNLESKNKLRQNVISSIVTELLINFDQLHFVSLTKGTYYLQDEALKTLTRSKFQINNNSIDSSYRELIRTYSVILDVKNLNSSTWQEIQVKSIVGLLQILSFADIFAGNAIDFMNSHDNFHGALVRNEENFFQAIDIYFNTNQSFWKMAEFKTNINIGTRKVENVNWNDLKSKIHENFDKSQIIEIELIVQEFVLHYLVSKFNTKKPIIVKNLNNKLENLIK